jgi:hypothetical protein
MKLLRSSLKPRTLRSRISLVGGATPRTLGLCSLIGTSRSCMTSSRLRFVVRWKAEGSDPAVAERAIRPQVGGFRPCQGPRLALALLPSRRTTRHVTGAGKLAGWVSSPLAAAAPRTRPIIIRWSHTPLTNGGSERHDVACLTLRPIETTRSRTGRGQSGTLDCQMPRGVDDQ